MTFKDLIWLDKQEESKPIDTSSIEKQNIEIKQEQISNHNQVQKVKVRKKVIKKNK